MANFFSLGSGGGGGGSGSGATPPQEHSQPNNNNPNNWAGNSSHPGLLLYRNEEIYQKGFEIWQQYVQVHHHPKLFHHQDHHQPFLHHGLYLGGGGGGGVDQMAGPSNLSVARSSSSGSRVMMRGGSSGGAGVGGINCQDCGNQAKKDCSHMRCRTCCKSRGFDCSTHVKSTWVPAAKRRERQQQQQQQQHSSETAMMREKRQRESSATANNPAAGSSRMGASTSGLEMGQHFPPEVSSPAMFRCVRVQSVENADEQLAYQTAVNIGGHLFKGILYDQGPDAHYSPAAAGDASSGGDPTLQQQNLLNNINPENASSSGVDPNAIYPPPISAFLAGTQFFPPPRS